MRGDLNKTLPALLLLAFLFSIPTLPIASLQEMQKNVETERKVYAPVHKAMEQKTCSAVSNLEYCMADAVRESKVNSVSRPGCVKDKHGLPGNVVVWDSENRIASFVSLDKGFRMWEDSPKTIYTVRFCYGD